MSYLVIITRVLFDYFHNLISMTTVSAVVAIDLSFVLTITFPSNIFKYANEENRHQINGKLAFRLTNEEKWSLEDILSFN